MPNKQLVKHKTAASLDKKSGSLAYNRFEMQISQTLHMAIELYSNLNYLLVLDHYDDITLFDDDVTPETVSYYQMKTSEDSISIDTAISEAWVAKLYEQLNHYIIISTFIPKGQSNLWLRKIVSRIIWKY